VNQQADKVEMITQSYRVPINILKAADRLISKNKTRIEKTVTSVKPNGVIRVSNYLDFKSITSFEGTTFILARTNQFIHKIGGELFQRGIRFDGVGGKTGIKYWDKKFISFINAIIRYRRGLSMEGHEIRSMLDLLPAKGIYGKGAKKKLMDILKEHKEDKLFLMTPENVGRYFTFKGDMPSLIRSAKISDRHRVILAGYVKEGELISESKPRISLGTIHSAKGLEADRVILFDDISPRIEEALTNDRLYGSGEILEEERRVAYVGMSRAKSELIVIHNYMGKGRCFNEIMMAIK
jgi:DNA helicase-2/ATP-dependent DNA helicase PcrA